MVCDDDDVGASDCSESVHVVHACVCRSDAFDGVGHDVTDKESIVSAKECKSRDDDTDG